MSLIFSAVTMTGSKFVTKGETIRLQCNATGSYQAPDDIDWFKDGNKLNPSVTNNIKIVTQLTFEERTLTSVLEVQHTNLEDAGIYVCRSTLEIASNHVHVLDGRSMSYFPFFSLFRCFAMIILLIISYVYVMRCFW